jgi:hypothetical protein
VESAELAPLERGRENESKRTAAGDSFAQAAISIGLSLHA